MLLFFSAFAYAQDSTKADKIYYQSSKLKKSIKNKDEKSTAEAYFQLAETYFASANYPKSEEFYKKALAIFEKENDKKNIAKTSRALAACQEKLNKAKLASANYSKASKNEPSINLKKVNTNDALRTSMVDKTKQEEAANDNVVELKNNDDKTNLAKGYEALAETQISNQKIAEATENYTNAYEISKDIAPEKAVYYNEKVTNLLAKNNNIGKAIELKKEIINQNFTKNNTEIQVKELQKLAFLYAKNNNNTMSEATLLEAFELSVKKGHTYEAQTSLLKLDSIYEAQNKPEKSLVLHQKFLKNLKIILETDQSLYNDKIISITEEKIQQLELEKKLQNDLLKRKSQFNTGLILFIVLLLALIGLILVVLKKIQLKNKKIALQSLRREMNPHFIFNSLNSINHFIAHNNEMEANNYLSKFSKLMRGVLENSTNDYNSMTTEIELITNYLQLEKSRFQENFDFEISISDELVHSDWKIPSMLVQPFIENAIWHGLRYKDSKGFIKIDSYQENQLLYISIKDNGIGIKKSIELKTTHQNQHKGRGMSNTLERINLLNSIYGKKIEYQIFDSYKGVTVQLKIRK